MNLPKPPHRFASLTPTSGGENTSKARPELMFHSTNAPTRFCPQASIHQMSAHRGVDSFGCQLQLPPTVPECLICISLQSIVWIPHGKVRGQEGAALDSTRLHAASMKLLQHFRLIDCVECIAQIDWQPTLERVQERVNKLLYNSPRLVFPCIYHFLVSFTLSNDSAQQNAAGCIISTITSLRGCCQQR